MAISSRSVQPRRKPATGPNRQAILIANGDLRA